MEKKIARFDDAADRLKSWISILDIKEEAKAKHEENIIQVEMFRRKIQEELKVQKMKSKDYEKRDKVVNEERVNMKLPKLIITKFDGTSLDWFRFWNQFESDWSEIDKTEISPVSKFSYLKELLIPRDRDYLLTAYLLYLKVIQEPNLYYLLSLVIPLKLLLLILSVLPHCLSFKINIQTEYRNDPNY